MITDVLHVKKITQMKMLLQYSSKHWHFFVCHVYTHGACLFIWSLDHRLMQESVHTYFHCGSRDRPIQGHWGWSLPGSLLASAILYVPLKVSETALPFIWPCKPWDINSLHCCRARNKSPQASPRNRARTWGRWGERCTCYHCTIAASTGNSAVWK